jgi:hypothetical protein
MTSAYKILRVKDYSDGKGVTCSYTKSYLQDGEFRFDETRFYVFVGPHESVDVVISNYMAESGWV